MRTTAVAAATAAFGFQDVTVLTGLTHPTSIAFAPDGRIFVAEQSGLVKEFSGPNDTTPTIFADLRTEVDNYWDRGLLGLTLDPSFQTNGRVYVLYTYDHILGSTQAAPKWSDACPSPPGATTDGCVVSGRLSRLASSGGAATSETVLIEGWCQQFPSHSVGKLAFDSQGRLLATAGDGASFSGIDYGQRGGTLPSTTSPVTRRNPCGDPPGGVGGSMTPPSAEGGMLRAQSVRRTDGPTVLNGALIRVDPNTGAGATGNPLATSTDANDRRILGFGFRNPFRFTTRPGTSEIWVGDVGWSTYEEIDRIAATGLQNAGWPCYEGAPRQPVLESAGLSLCQSLYAAGGVVSPVLAYNHSASVVSGDGCPTANGSSISGLAFYGGSAFPTRLHGALFFTDYSRQCMWAMRLGTNGQPDPKQVETIESPAGGIVNLETAPDGNLYMVDYLAGSIRRLDYIGANRQPVASFTATPSSGAAPLTVAFNAAASSDADLDPLSYSWDLDGNGTFGDATGVRTSRTYSSPAQVTVGLRVSDGRGGLGATTRTIQVGNTPPVPVISTPAATLHWAVGDTISFSGKATDTQDGTLPASALNWELLLHHCPTVNACHTHSVETWAGVASGSFSAPDHEYPSYLELRLTAKDSAGSSVTKSLRLDPRVVTITVATDPVGLSASLNTQTGAAPLSHQVIVGSTNTIGVASPQTIGTVSSNFIRWTDGGAREHPVIAGSTNSTITAVFEAPDRTAPTMTSLAVRGRTGVTIGSNPISVTWAATDLRSAIRKYDLQVSRDGAAFQTIALSSATATRYDTVIAFGHQAAFRARATDTGGNVSAWRTTPTVAPVAVQETSTAVHYAGTWSGSTSTTWWGGSLKAATASGAAASYTFSGRVIEWISTKGPDRGVARVYIDGVLNATVDLNATTLKARQVVFAANVTTSVSHTIRVVVAGTAGRPRVDVDGFVRIT
ncbi:MAG: PQQ-dependent sugar dehydrogenase [Chloroflexota bacterium]